ncbi:MAG: hypothetical protein FD147_96 [Chloroflexi bacterium]|nr:MAG: hypothetical protein FD147_96 [Chloroflexota bacterium]MBA4374724.1 hypothetical protein [Anaerolinea sp.]
MIKNLLNKKYYLLILLIVTLFSLLTVANYQFSKNNPGGNDFLVHWIGAKKFLAEGVSPYSDQTALEIQKTVYGRPAMTGEHELRVAYPLYSIFIFAPFALIKDFTVARALWMSVLEFSIVGIIILSIRINHWKVRPWMIGSFLLFGIFFYHGIRPLINGNAVILVTLGLLVAIIAIRNGQDEIAGLILAFSTIKPQNVILVLFFILIWAAFHRRTKIITWFAGTMVLLVGFSILLIPDWIFQNIREVLRYSSYNPPGSPGAALIAWWGNIGTRLSIGLSALLSILLVLEWWKSRNSGIKQFIWTVMVTMTISQWIGIQTDPGNFILLYPALFVGLELLWERWDNRSYGISYAFLAFLFVSIWVLFLTTLNIDYQPIQSSILLFPFPLFVFILLYWSRWWVQKSNHINFKNNKIDL